mgnify:FL=1
MQLTSNNKHTLLNERYRPTTLEGYVGNEQLKTTIAKYLEVNDIQNYLFHGLAGTGKTTLAKIVINNLDCESLYINASDERGIETIRDKVVGFASVASFKPLKVVILDEADFLTIQAQASLRNVIETYSKSTRFILTCNFIERIIDPIQSRCQTFKIQAPTKSDVAKHLVNILETEKTNFDLEQIKSLVNQYYPDIRKMLNTIQASTVDNTLSLDKSTLTSTSYMSDVLKELTLDKPNYTNIRQIIADAEVSDFDGLHRYLFDNSNQFLPNKQGTVAMIINEHQYQSNFRIDKEINTMSLIQNLINNK